MIFQEPMNSFSPLYTIGNQLTEAILLHQKIDKKAARELAIEMLEQVGIPNATRRIDNYPFEFSGGMRQRAMIARRCSSNPSLLIADEPTTALDVTIQAQILELMRNLQQETDTVDHLHHPQPGRGGADCQPDRDHVPGTGGRGRHRAGYLQRSACTLILEPAASRCQPIGKTPASA